MKSMTLRKMGMAVGIAMCLCISAKALFGADALRIGAILSLSGSAAANGQSMRDGILLATEEINKRPLMRSTPWS
jgi:ABC-type branched-subunit amino acid transport system substrate-binding protein